MKYILILLMLSLAAPAFAADPAVAPMTKLAKDALYDDLTANLACRCGCGTTLKTCPHENCSFAVPARKEIRGFIDQGMEREAIKAQMVSLHGEAILAQPTFYGFNTLAWITPFVAIMLVGYGVAVVAKKWASAKTPAQAKKPAEGTQKTDPYLKKLHDELDKFEG